MIFFFSCLQMNSGVIYGTRTAQKKTNPRSGKVISSCEAVHTGLHLNGIWNVHPKVSIGFIIACIIAGVR